MASVTARLKKLQKEYAAAEANEGFSSLADGKFIARIDSACVEESQNGRLQACYNITFLDGDNAGRTQKVFDGLEEEVNLSFAKGRLLRIDVDPPDKLVDLPEVLDELEGIGVAVTVKTKDEYQNVYFNEVVDIDDDGSTDEIDLDEMDKEQLLQLVEDEEIEIKGIKKMTEKKLRKAISEALEEEKEEEEDTEEDDEDEDSEEDEDDDGESEDEDDESDEVDVNAMSKGELIDFIDEEELEIDGNHKRTSVKSLRKKVREALEEDED